jgi:hypothetical protein
MPTVQWGISRGTLTNYERSSFKPYDGELPPNRIFRWKIRKMVYKAATAESPAQLQMGLELIPRKGRNDERYAGYYLTVFQRITDSSVYYWGPILDALHVSEAAFQAAKIDNEGNIRSMGKWRNDGNQFIMGRLADDNYNGKIGKKIDWWGEDTGEAAPDIDDEEDEEYDEEEYESDEEEYDSDEDYDEEDEEDWEEEEEEEPAPPARKRRR